MKKNLQTAALLVAFGLLTLGAAICPAQAGMMVGGFRQVAATDETVAAAAAFAVEAHSAAVPDKTLALVSVLSAERQIVAGSNYKMCLALTSKGAAQQAQATVYLNLQNKFALSKWVDGSCNASQTSATTAPAAVAPDELVKSLYAAEKAGKSPFFQTKNRALVDKYFSKDFADLIWKDAITANGEVGVIDGDPLYNAQDMKITAFAIGAPEYDTATGSGMATVLVSFRNFGKRDTVKYLFARDAAGSWKISDMVFKNGDMLKGILTAAQK